MKNIFLHKLIIGLNVKITINFLILLNSVFLKKTFLENNKANITFRTKYYKPLKTDLLEDII